MGTVVVGVDGSEHGELALRFAAEEAALRAAELRIVCAWQLPPSMGFDMGLAPDVFESFRDEAHIIAAEAQTQAESLRPDVVIHTQVIEGPPARVLLEEAHDATLLVVGSRGRGGLAGMLLGSVSRHVVHQARCPVTVVPKRD